MHRKVVAIGNSKGVSIPVEILNKLDLAAGSDVNVELDEEQERIVIVPVRKKRKVPGIDKAFAGPSRSAPRPDLKASPATVAVSCP